MLHFEPPPNALGSPAFAECAHLIAGDDDMPHRVVRRMKAMLLEAQALSSKAQADQRIAAAEAAALISKIKYAFALSKTVLLSHTVLHDSLHFATPRANAALQP